MNFFVNEENNWLFRQKVTRKDKTHLELRFFYRVRVGGWYALYRSNASIMIAFQKIKKYLLSHVYSVPPSEPENVRIVATSTTLKITWEEGEQTSEYNYNRYELEIEPQRKEIKEALGSLSWMPIYEGTDRSFFIENLQPKMPFHVRVRAINSAGQSQWVLLETETKE